MLDPTSVHPAGGRLHSSPARVSRLRRTSRHSHTELVRARPQYPQIWVGMWCSVFILVLLKLSFELGNPLELRRARPVGVQLLPRPRERPGQLDLAGRGRPEGVKVRTVIHGGTGTGGRGAGRGAAGTRGAAAGADNARPGGQKTNSASRTSAFLQKS